MTIFIPHILVFFSALLLAFLLVPLVKRQAPSWGLVDQPSERRIHKTAIPRCGGIAVFMATHIALLLAFMGPWDIHQGMINAPEWVDLLIGSSLLFALGLWDDRFGMRAGPKLLGQTAVASLMFFFGFSFEHLLGFHVPVLLDYAATLFWFVLLINAFNLVDGMDGACAGLGVVSASAMAVFLFILHQSSDSLASLALAGACLGFLRYNFHPASIFLGDCGSMFIGFMLAAVSLKANASQSMVLTLLVPLLAVGVPVFDVLLAVWRRIGRKLLSLMLKDEAVTHVFGPDLDHIHHKLLKSGMSQRKAALTLYIGAIAFSLFAFANIFFHNQQTALFLLGLVAVVYVAVRQLAHIELWTTAKVFLTGVDQLRGFVRLAIYMGGDLLVFMSVSLWLHYSYYHNWYGVAWTTLFVWVPFVVLSIFKTYRICWSQARPGQYLKLLLEIICAELIVFAVFIFVSNLPQIELVKAVLLHGMVSSIFILSGRMAPSLVGDLLAWMRHSPNDLSNTLLLGSKTMAHAFLSLAQNDSVNRRIIGIVDNDPDMQGMIVYGYPVMGSFDQIERLITEHQITELLVSDNELQHQREPLLALQKKYGLSIRVFRVGLYELDGSFASSLAR